MFRSVLPAPFTTVAFRNAVRFHSAAAVSVGGKKFDLFGYEVSTETAPWIEKIKKVQFYDDAGDVIVQMNLANTPPDLATYNATLQKIFECKSKKEEPVPNESKLCAMLDLIEEMKQRNGISPDKDSWTWVMKECVASANFRMGYIVESIMRNGNMEIQADLLSQNEASAQKAKSDGREHPAVLSRQTALFDTVDKQ